MVAGLTQRAIAELIRSDNVDGLRTFLETRHANLEDKDDEGNTALHLAAAQGKIEIVSLLIENGADVNAEDEEKCTPLHIAAREGHKDICLLLLDAGSKIDASDIGVWTPLIWACYQSHLEVVDALISSGADPNSRGQYHASGLLWAAGRGCVEIVQLLLDNGCKVDVGDKYGTTALIWACRKGHTDIVEVLLRAGARVDVVGMYSWTPLLVAVAGNYPEIVDLLLEKGPNVNTVDRDGHTALAIACKEGFQEIALSLLSAGAYTNIQDRAGDTNLIHASKGGHKAIVKALLKKHADIDVKGKDNKTCLHWAIDKNHPDIVKTLLQANPDLEIKTVEGDTPLLRAVRNRNAEVVQLLLDKKAKINTTDSKGDTALHIAMRARSKGIVEVLLRNPKHSQLLYRPNRQGETPYSIDANSQKTIIGQVFGTRDLNKQEDSENILGYDLYSSCLADILTEPTLTMPISVGLYAKWGSGKSFLLGKLREEMKNFAREWVDPTIRNSPMLLFVILHLACAVGVIAWLISYLSELGMASNFVGLALGLAMLVCSYLLLFGIWQGSFKYDSFTLYNLNVFLAKKFNSLKLILQVLFCHPPGPDWSGSMKHAEPLRLLFTDQTKVITSSGGQNSVTQMIGSLFDAIEAQYGMFSTRLYRAFRPKAIKQTSSLRYRQLCCIPYIFIYLACYLCVLVGIVLIGLSLNYHEDTPVQLSQNYTLSKQELMDGEVFHSVKKSGEAQTVIFVLLVIVGCIIGVVLVANIYTVGECIKALVFSQRRQLQRAVAKLDVVKSEGYLQAVKNEVQFLLEMLKCLDAFTRQQTRLVVVVDGLDSCEQAKVLSVLDAVHMLFSDPGSPFILILAIDPHVIIKAIEMNLSQAFSETSISGAAYLRNIVHLPFFLQNAGLRRVKAAQLVASTLKMKSHPSTAWMENDDGSSRRLSTESLISTSKAKSKFSSKGPPSSRKLTKLSESSHHSSIGSNINVNKVGTTEPTDLTKMLLTDDYFSDVNPRSMRRLMNVIYVMGRLLKAFHIDFNWYHLAAWVNITEQWPYRTSWITFYADVNDETLEDSIALKTLYERVKAIIPTHKELEPLLEMDKDEKKLDTFLNFHKKTLTLADLKIFRPFSINLDPYIRKVIKVEVQNLEELGMEVNIIMNATQQPQVNSSSVGPLSGPNAPLTRRQAAGLSRKMSQIDVTAANKGMSGIYPGFGNPMLMPPMPNPMNPMNSAMNPMWAFGTGGNPPNPMLYRQQQQQMFGTKQKEEDEDRSPSPPIVVPMEMLDKPLSEKSVGEICSLIKSLTGLTDNMLETYCSAITSQNLSGPVLFNCHLDELKSVLNMNFGDWELFRMVLKLLRKNERKMKESGRVKFSLGSEQIVNVENERSASPPSERTTGRKTRGENVIERQVTMEDAMISGLLSTLNEEAQEDILTEELLSTQTSREDLSQRKSSVHSVRNGGDPVKVVYLSHASGPSGHVNVEKFDESNIEGGAAWFNSRVSAGIIGGVDTSVPSHSWHGSQEAMASVPTSPSASEPIRSPLLSTDLPPSRNEVIGSKQRLNSESLDLEDDDPYAWLSRTAPSTPQLASRRGSTADEESHQSMLSLFNIGRRSRRSTISEDPTATEGTSSDKLGKLKKRIKQSLSHHDPTAIPAVHKAKRHRNDSSSSGGLLSRLSSRRNSHVNTDDSDDSSCSSPEQQTVAKRPSLSRGPHVQKLFELSEGKAEDSSNGDKS